MKLLIIVVLSLGAGLGGVPSAVLAQGPVVVDDASGADGTCTTTSSADGQLTFCKDLRPGRGVAVVDPAPAPAPVADDGSAEPAPETDAAPETSERAVASATDQDADNALDEQEPGLGLDPTNPDTDADGVADGDEPNIYGTDPLIADTDGDGIGDGEELFGIHTDPLVGEAGSAAESPGTAGAS